MHAKPHPVTYGDSNTHRHGDAHSRYPCAITDEYMLHVFADTDSHSDGDSNSHANTIRCDGDMLLTVTFANGYSDDYPYDFLLQHYTDADSHRHRNCHGHRDGDVSARYARHVHQPDRCDGERSPLLHAAGEYDVDGRGGQQRTRMRCSSDWRRDHYGSRFYISRERRLAERLRGQRRVCDVAAKLRQSRLLFEPFSMQ